MIWRLMIWRSKDRFTAENAEFSEEPKICLLGVLGDLCVKDFH
jgi:hypothetical protein